MLKLRRIISVLICVTMISTTLVGCETNNINIIDEEKSNEINVLTATYPLDLNPYTCTDTETISIFNSIYEGLTALDSSGNVYLQQAKELTFSEDRLTATIKLKDGIKYADGKEVTAQDYVTSWQTAISPSTNSAYSSMFDIIVNGYDIRKGNLPPTQLGAIALDDKTIQVNLTAPYDKFADMLSMPLFYPIRVDDKGNLIGNGAYKIDKYTANENLSLIKNENYYNSSKVNIDKINFKLKPQEINSAKDFNEENLQFTDHLSTDALSSLSVRDEFATTELLSTVCLSFQTAKVPYSIPEVRKALSLGIDRSKLVSSSATGDLTTASALIPSGISDYTTGSSFRDYKTSYYTMNSSAIGEAKQYLSTSGYPLGKNFPTINLVYDKTKNQKQAELIQKMWYENLGVTAKLTGLDTAPFDYAVKSGDYDVAITSITAKYNDPLTMLDCFTSDSKQNYRRYASAEYDEIISASKASSSSDERYTLLHQAEDLLMTDLPIAPLYYDKNSHLKYTALQDVLISPFGYYNFNFSTLE